MSGGVETSRADLDLRALEDFLVGDRDLECLEALLDRFNILEALGVVRQELRHSDFLTFLMDTRGNHGEGAGDTPKVRSDARRRWPGWTAYAAGAWALAFAAIHLYWALGGAVGLPKGMSVGMNPTLFVIDVLAVPLCVVGALLALSLVRPWGHLFPRRLLLAGAWAVCALLIVHSAPTLVEGGLVVTGLRDAKLSLLDRWSLFVYEPWFFLGGLLYGVAAWGYGRRRST